MPVLAVPCPAGSAGGTGDPHPQFPIPIPIAIPGPARPGRFPASAALARPRGAEQPPRPGTS